MIALSDTYPIGRIGKTHGVKGELAFYFQDDAWLEGEYLLLSLNDILVPFFLEEWRCTSEERALIKLEGIDSQEEAAEIVGTEVYYLIPNSEFRIPHSNNSAFRIPHSALNYSIDTEDRALGKVVDIDNQTENVMFVLDSGLLIPVVEEWVIDIDENQRVIRLELPEGLLDL